MPINLEGVLQPGIFDIPGDISSQFITGLLFTLPLLNKDSKINVVSELQSQPYIMMTLQVLKEYGITINYDPGRMIFEIPGNQRYKAVPYYAVEGDWSQAAFLRHGSIIGQHYS